MCTFGHLEDFVFLSKIQIELKSSIFWDIAQWSEAIIRFSWICTFFGLFSTLPTFLSSQKGSGSCKNSHRKLRVYTFRSQNLVNMCWPFSQHIDTLRSCVFVKCPWLIFVKNVFLIFTSDYVPKHDSRSLYCRKWKL